MFSFLRQQKFSFLLLCCIQNRFNIVKVESYKIKWHFFMPVLQKEYQLIYMLILSPLLLLFSHSVVSDSLRPHELHRARLPCPSLSPRVSSDSCPLNQWCYPTILSSVVPFSCPLSFPASKSFPMSQFFGSGSQSIGVLDSSSVLPSFPLLTEIFLLESFYYKPLEKRTLDQE